MVRDAVVGEAAGLAELHAKCFETPWTAEFWLHETQSAISELLVAEGERTIGFALARAVTDEAELLSFAVDPSSRRRGIGRQLLSAMVCRLAKRGCCRIYLEVAKSNDAARSLYESLGFMEVGRRPGYYVRPDSPPEDALVLARDVEAQAAPTHGAKV